MIKHLCICDLCGDECIDGTFYVVSIGKGAADDRLSMLEVYDCDDYRKHLCKNCMESIRDFIKTYPVKDFHIKEE